MRQDNYQYRQLRKQILSKSPACIYCGNLADQVDHVFPVARGGTNRQDNLVPCCSQCNKRKGAKLNYVPTSYINRRFLT